MQIDMHYYAIAFLAYAAGFEKNDALTIAYASQYVDDATEGDPIRIGDIFFDPVRTAHAGLKAFEWSIQKKVFIPFHFLPPEPMSNDRCSFATRKDSVFANDLLDEALGERNAKLKLIRLGIALHTYADSWAHKDFAGIELSSNDVEAIELFEDGKWGHLFFQNIYLDVLPKIGHAQAGGYPDKPYLRWKYKRGEAEIPMERNHPSEYFEALERIYRVLKRAFGRNKPARLKWPDIAADLSLRLHAGEEDIDTRVAAWMRLWRKHFGSTQHVRYDKLRWRMKALKGLTRDDASWDDRNRSRFADMEFKSYDGFYETDWVLFHRAALKQRHWVLEHLV